MTHQTKHQAGLQFLKEKWRFVVPIALFTVGVSLILFSSLYRAPSKTTPQETLPDEALELTTERDSKQNEDVRECGAGEIVVQPKVNSTSFAADEDPEFSLTVENISKTRCYRNLGTSQMLFEVETGTEPVWSSKDCQLQPDDRLVILEPGEPLETEPVTWNRQYSDPETCGAENETAVADGAAYHLLVAVGSVPGKSSAQFLLH